MAVSPDVFRASMSRFAAGVTIVTAATTDGPSGMTATAFSSVSLDPPLVLVCLDRNSTTYRAVLEAPAFGVHFLPEGAEEISGAFARRGADKFSVCSWSMGESGAPLIEGALVCLECHVEALYEAGDHVVVIGRVERAEVAEDDAGPLVYFRGEYRALGPT